MISSECGDWCLPDIGPFALKPCVGSFHQRLAIRCQTGTLAALALSLTLAACTTAPVTACPPTVTYSKAQETRAAAELRALPAGSELAQMIVDYSRSRAMLRACSTAH